MRQSVADALAYKLIEEWAALTAEYHAVNTRKADVARSAKALGLDIDWFKQGVVVWRQKPAPRPFPEGLRATVAPLSLRYWESERFTDGLPPSSLKRRPSFVYFAVAMSAGLLKVGITTVLEKRIKQLRAAPDVPVELWGHYEGKRSDEAVAHKALSSHLVAGEWFRLCERSAEISIALMAEHGVVADSPLSNVVPLNLRASS